MLMRVSVGIHKKDIESVLKTYHTMSQRWFTHASPTLFNAGTPRPQVCHAFPIPWFIFLDVCYSRKLPKFWDPN